MQYPELPTLKARFAWARQQSGLSYDRLAERLEHPVNWLILRQIEKGQSERTTPALLDDLAKALNVDRHWFTTEPVIQPAAPRQPAPSATSRVLAAGPPSLSDVSWLPGTIKTTDAESQGGRVRIARQKLGLSQVGLAQQISRRVGFNVSGSTISAIEHNKITNTVGEKTLEVVKGYLHIDGAKLPEAAPPPQPSKDDGERIVVADYPGAGPRIHALRLALGKSQRELGEPIGIEQSYVSRLERDKQIPAISVTALAATLHSTPEYILYGRGNGPVLSPQPEAVGFVESTVPEVTLPAEKIAPATPAVPAARLTERSQPLPPRPLAKSEPVTETEARDLVRPRQVDSLQVIADKTGIYLFCGRRGFRRSGTVMTPVSEGVANLAISPDLAELIIEDLRDAVKQCRANRRG